MKTTKQHFELIARIIARATINARHTNHCGAECFACELRYLAQDFASVFGEENSRFNRDRFMQACGLGDQD
jgi:hypothetical protein